MGTKMRVEKKGDMKNSVERVGVVVLLLLLQIAWIVLLLLKLNEYSIWISGFSGLLGLIVVLYIYGQHKNAAFKMPWIMLILVFPVFGLCMYLLFGNSGATAGVRRKYAKLDAVLLQELKQEENVMQQLEKYDFSIANQCRYIWNYGKYPVYSNTDVEFFAEAVDGFESQLEELKKAEQFIFMEYHAIEDALSFKRLKDVLAARVKAGVEVRILYDDIGSIGFLNPAFIKNMEQMGIQCRVFNPVIPLLNIFMNNRDHRKITVIDGKIGYTGGYNLADEYFNITHPYGYWKDTGIKLKGEAVKSLTVMFLEMWNAVKETDEDYKKFLPSTSCDTKEHVFVQPYADSPLDEEYVGENVYLNMIKSANHYFYLATPYLIISDEMTRELGLAAQRGVDVRVITPGIPDKKLIYGVTRSYYAGLAGKGVRIYEYTPGFIHQKQTLCDGKTAVVGTINMDFRSLYHHFENGAFICGGSAVESIEADFLQIIGVSEEVTEKYASGRSAVLRLKQCVLRLFAPLM